MHTTTSQINNLFKYISGRAKYLEKKIRQGLFKSREDVFTHHYENNSWGDDESKSGPGSNKNYTKNIRIRLPDLMNDLQVTTILDAPCGDHFWFNLIEWEIPINYLGADIVKSLINNNNERFSNDSVRFRYLDIVNNPLPDADIWLCRDCFIHLSNKDIFKSLDNFYTSNIDYILLSNYPNCKNNENIPTGNYRHYNLMLPPFNFPSPISTIDDWVEGFPVRNLSLWRRRDLASSFHAKQ